MLIICFSLHDEHTFSIFCVHKGKKNKTILSLKKCLKFFTSSKTNLFSVEEKLKLMRYIKPELITSNFLN